MEYLKLIDENREEMLDTLSKFIQKKSVEGDPVQTEDKGFLPFGTGVHEAFEFILGLGEKEGFRTCNVDNYGGHIDFGPADAEETMAIIGHVDVVPEGDGWTYDPYGGIIADGKMWGRGTIDDKGPVMASFFAMKALKDAGFEPSKKVRLIIGLDEETNWKGIEYYFSKVEKPDFGFTPDADFPAIHAEKGIMVFRLAKKFGKSRDKGLELRSFTGGNAPNMVADHARAVVRDEDMKAYDKIKEIVAEYRNETGYKVNVKGIGKSLEITATGKSAHGAMPENGLNAISILMDLFGKLDFVNEDVSDFIDFYNEHINFNTEGKGMGCCFSDEESGNLVFNVGMIELDEEAVTLTVNVRYPITMSADDVYAGMTPVVGKYDIGIVKESDQKPIYIPVDDPLITTLMDVYREHTGDTESEPIVIGGGTYARACDGIVAFGANYPGDPQVEHQKDEFIDIEKFVLATKIYADAIYRLTK